MTGMHLVYPFFTFGTPTATYKAIISLPVSATLIEVSTSATNSHAGVLDIGTNADFDGYLDAYTMGGVTPSIATRSDFNGALTTSGEPLHFEKGAQIQIQVSSTGSYPKDPCVILTFLEG